MTLWLWATIENVVLAVFLLIKCKTSVEGYFSFLLLCVFFAMTVISLAAE